MWIDKNKSNAVKTVYVMDYIDPLTNKRKYASATIKGKATKRQYNETLLLLQKKIAKKLDKPLHNENRTFESVALEWLEEHKKKVKYSTWYGYQSRLKEILKYVDCKVIINNINHIYINKVIDYYYHECNLSFSVAKTVKFILVSTVKYAEYCGYIKEISYLHKVKINRKVKSIEDIKKESNKFLDKKELTEVIKTIAKYNTRYAMLCEFMALTGLRVGEAVAIQCDDVDFNNQLLKVNATIAFASVNFIPTRTTPKTATAYRTISLNDRCIEILNIMMIENKKARLLTRRYQERGYIFTTKYGYPINYNNLNKLLQSIQKKIQLDKHLTSHIFRHTHISILTELGLPLKSIMQRVGHTNPNTTLKIYTHVTDEMTKELNSKLNDFKLEIS